MMRNKVLIAVIAASAFVLSAQSAIAGITTTINNADVTNHQTGANVADVNMNSSTKSAASAQAGAGNIDIQDGCCTSQNDIQTTVTNTKVTSTQTGWNKATVNMNGQGNLGTAAAGYGNLIIMRDPGN